MNFNNVTTTYDNTPFGAPILHHQQQQSGSFTNHLPVSTTNIHHNLPHYYLPQSLGFLDKQPHMHATMTDQATPSNSKDNNKKKPKRKQVKNACVNCQKACKKCDDGRACQRCIKLGLTATCVDSPRKERRKGIKRGPYKKRQPRAEQQQKQASQQPSQLMLYTEWLDNNKSSMEYRDSSSSPSSATSISSPWNQQQFSSMEQVSFGSGNFLEQPCYPTTNDMASFIQTHDNNIQCTSSSSSEDGFSQSPSISSSIAHSPCSPATPPPAVSTPFPVVRSQQSYSQQVAFLQKQQQRTMEQQKIIEQQIALSMQKQEEKEQELLFAKQQAQQYHQQQQFFQASQYNMTVPTDSWQFFL